MKQFLPSVFIPLFCSQERCPAGSRWLSSVLPTMAGESGNKPSGSVPSPAEHEGAYGLLLTMHSTRLLVAAQVSGTRMVFGGQREIPPTPFHLGASC